MSERPSLRDSGPDPADPVAAELEAIRQRAGWVRTTEQSTATDAPYTLSVARRNSARDVRPLLAAVEAALKHHQPGKLPWCGTCGPQHQPCQEMADIHRALLGPETSSAEMEG